jgi:hypothetical protein
VDGVQGRRGARRRGRELAGDDMTEGTEPRMPAVRAGDEGMAQEEAA